MAPYSKIDFINRISGRKSRWLLHLAFWLTVLVFYTFFFGYRSVDYRITFSFVAVLLPVTMLTTYFLNYWLIPQYLFKKRYGKFILYFLYTLIVSFFVEMLTVMGIFIVVANMNMAELHPSNTNAILLIAGMYVVVFLGVAVKLMNHYNSNQVEIQRLKKEKVEAELKFLKAQLHPHFLFNTLNNLYALTLEKSERASDVVLKLSEMLDYVLYECREDFVPLGHEIKQVENYIGLERLRFGDRLDVTFNRQNVPVKALVPPMVLLTLVENSFKHGISKAMERSWIRLNVHVDNGRIIFHVANSRGPDHDPPKEISGGIGLKNLRDRLELIYKHDYKLIFSGDEESFEVQLEIITLATDENAMPDRR